MEIKYFDHAATTKINQEVLKEMLPYLTEGYGNASSPYKIGRQSKKALETARKRVAGLINVKPNEVYFTSCGSESDNMALKGIARRNKHKGNHIITTKIEHPAILETCKSLEKEGFEITYLNVNKEGEISISELENKITDRTILISVMFANNEIGTIQPIEQIGLIARKHNIYFHTDAVQAVGNVNIDAQKLNIDLLSLSGHKIYAPKGIGALYVRDGIEFDRFLDGGHQEKNKRAGTENVASIVGLGKACEIAKNNLENNIKHLSELRDYFFDRVQKEFKNVRINGSIKNRLPGNCNLSFKDMDGQEILYKLDEKGMCISTGSACSSGESGPSHVLLAIGLEKEYASGAIRVTFGLENTKEDVDDLISALNEIC